MYLFINNTVQQEIKTGNGIGGSRTIFDPQFNGTFHFSVAVQGF